MSESSFTYTFSLFAFVTLKYTMNISHILIFFNSRCSRAGKPVGRTWTLPSVGQNGVVLSFELWWLQVEYELSILPQSSPLPSVLYSDLCTVSLLAKHMKAFVVFTPNMIFIAYYFILWLGHTWLKQFLLLGTYLVVSNYYKQCCEEHP